MDRQAVGKVVPCLAVTTLRFLPWRRAWPRALWTDRCCLLQPEDSLAMFQGRTPNICCPRAGG